MAEGTEGFRGAAQDLMREAEGFKHYARNPPNGYRRSDLHLVGGT